MKKQVIVIHGGDSFETREKFQEALKSWEVSVDSFMPKYDWKICLQKNIGENFQVLSPRMPNKQNARYAEWKIWFERMTPFLEESVILVGHSLGGLFLAKYLSENIFPQKISALFLVAAPHNQTDDIGDFQLQNGLEGVWDQCQKIHIFQSEDDQIVPASEAKDYQRAWPGAKMHIFQDRGHFNQEDFPELVEEILTMA